MPKQMRDRILAAAIREFSDRGYDGTSTRHIASRANCGEPSIYRIYKTKSALFLEAVRSALLADTPYIPSADVPLEVTSVQFMQQLERSWKAHPERFRLFVVASLSRDRKVHKIIREAVSSMYEQILPVALERQRTGVLRQEVHSVVITMMLTAAAGYHFMLCDILGLEHLNGYGLETEEYIEAVSRIWIKGVRGEG